MNEVKDFLKESKTYYLATIEDNKSRVRPFGTVEVYDNHLYIQTGKNKNVYKQIKKNNNVEICAFNNGRWIRVEGKLIEDNRKEAKKHMLDNYPELRGMYNENDDNTIVLYFESAHAVIASFESDPIVIDF